ncbi:hypothetical protein Tco_0481588 [Tanacetum coccineum]
MNKRIPEEHDVIDISGEEFSRRSHTSNPGSYRVPYSTPKTQAYQYQNTTCRPSIVTYRSVYTDSEPWRFQWVSDDEPKAPVEAPSSPNYVPGPEHTPSPDYVLGPEEPEQAPLSPNYVPEPQRIPEEDPAIYPVERRGDDYLEESSNDDDDDEELEDSEDDDEEEEEHLALADSSIVPVDDHVPSAEDTEAFEIRDESAPTHALIAEYASAPTPPSPPSSPLSPLSSPLPQIPSPPLTLPAPPTTSPTYAEAPLGYRVAGIRLRAASPSTHHPSEIPSPPMLLPSTSHIDDTPEADMLLRKRARFTTLTSGFKVGESSAAAGARQPVLDVITGGCHPWMYCVWIVGHRIEDVWEDMRASKARCTMQSGMETTIYSNHEAITFELQGNQLRLVCTIALARIQTLEGREPARIDDTENAGSSYALADLEANRTSRNGDDSHDSGTGSRRIERDARECNYSNFLKCQPLNFKGTKGVVGPGEKKQYGVSKPLCPKCNYHHDGQCAPKCTNCKRTGHLTQGPINHPATQQQLESPQGTNTNSNDVNGNVPPKQPYALNLFDTHGADQEFRVYPAFSSYD